VELGDCDCDCDSVAPLVTEASPSDPVVDTGLWNVVSTGGLTEISKPDAVVPEADIVGVVVSPDTAVDVTPGISVAIMVACVLETASSIPSQIL